MSKRIPCEMLYNCKDEKYSESIRRFQGCPTIAITQNGRILWDGIQAAAGNRTWITITC